MSTFCWIRSTFLLFRPSFDVQRRDLLARIVELLPPLVQITDLLNDVVTLQDLTLRFILEAGRFV